MISIFLRSMTKASENIIVRNTPETRVIDGGLEQDPEIQSVQQRFERIDQQHGYHGVLRAARFLPNCALDWHCTLYVRQMPAAVGKKSTVEQGKIRRFFSIPNHVIQKNPSHGARHGPHVRQTSTTKPTICSKRPGESSAAQSWKSSKQIFFVGNH